MAVDTAGNVYIVDSHNPCKGSTGQCDSITKTGRVSDIRVLKLDTGSNTATVLPITGLDISSDVAVDDHQNVFAVGGNGVVLKLPVRS